MSLDIPTIILGGILALWNGIQQIQLNFCSKCKYYQEYAKKEKEGLMPPKAS